MARYSISFRPILSLSIFAAFLAVVPSAPAQIQVVPLAKPASWPKTISLKRYVLNDDQMFHTAILSGVMPADWNVKGGVIWKMQLGTPDLLRIHWGDAQDVRGFDVYPYLTFCWGQRIQALGIPTYMGSIVQAPPSDQFDAIDKVIIPFFRQDLADARVVNQQKAPDVAKAEYDKLSQMYPGGMFAIEVWSGSETFEYDKNGQTIQEVVSVTLDEAENRRLGNITWSISSANSVRAPKGELDQLAVPRTVIFQSIQANPDWNQQVADFLARRQGQLAVRQQNQFDQTENRINAQTSANDAEHQQFNQHMSDLDRQSDAEADVQREVSPWTTSDGTSCKLPTQYGYAWSGADGRIIMNNDPQYNPNSDPNLSSTNWTAMQQAGN